MKNRTSQRNRTIGLLGILLASLLLVHCSPPKAAAPPVVFTAEIQSTLEASPAPDQLPSTATLDAAAPASLATATAYAKLPGGQLIPQIAVVPLADIDVQYPGLSGRLLYTSFDGIFEYDMTSGESKQLFEVENFGFLTDAAWTHDGSQIAFTYSAPSEGGVISSGASDIYIMNADGSDVRTLIVDEATTSNLGDVFWSSDGQWLYFSYYDFERDEDGFTYMLQVQRAAPDGSGRAVVLEDGFQASLTTDDQYITFLRNDPQSFAQSLWVANLDGSDARELVPFDRFYAIYLPRFAPDGKTIIFAASGDPSQLPPAPQQSSGDLFEPPSVSAHGLPWDLYTINIDGSNLQMLTTLNEDQPSALYTPDGRYILFLGTYGMYVMHADGTQLMRLRSEGAHGTLDLLP